MNHMMITQAKRLTHALKHYWDLLKFSEAGLLRAECPLCAAPGLVRLRQREDAIRCPCCRGAVVSMSLALAVRKYAGSLAGKQSYELSSRGAFVNFLNRQGALVTSSEYWPNVAPGEWHQGVQCQNVEQLTYADSTFDLCTSTEVFEHVVNDIAGFREMHRVLKTGGKLIFSVPLNLGGLTLERAKIEHGEIVHLTDPEYHDDLIRGSAKVLAFRTYGVDIVDRLISAGFEDAFIEAAPTTVLGGYGRAIVVATK